MIRAFDSFTSIHDWRLVVLALVLCFLSGLAAISLFHRARATQGRTRGIWFLTAAAVTGCGIWATHFVAVLAYEPGASVGQKISLTALSLLLAVIVTSAGLALALYGRSRWAGAAAGAIVGLAVAAMHYTGMAAFDLPGRPTWSGGLVVASILVAMLFGAGAFALATRGDALRTTLAAATLLTLALMAHSFIAMGALEVRPDRARMATALALDPKTAALIIGGIVAALLGLGLLAALSDRRSKQELDEQVKRLDAALNNMRRGLCMFDSQGRLVIWNQRYVEMYALPRDSVRAGCSIRDLLALRQPGALPSGGIDEYMATLSAATAKGDPCTMLFDLSDGRITAVVTQPLPDGGWVMTEEDITERQTAERELDRTRKFLDTVIESVPATLVVRDARDRRYVLVNRAGEEFFGMPREEIIGKSPCEVFGAAQADAILARDGEVLRSESGIVIQEHLVMTPRNGQRLVTSKRLVISDETRTPQYILGVLEDVTERKAAETRIAHLANHDALTDLPNRMAFKERLAATLRDAAENGDEPFAVICIDFDRFKEVNDVFGHSVGDALLCEISRRLEGAADGAFLARLGGDEFTVIGLGPQPATAEILAERLLATVDSDFEVDGHKLRVGLSIGAAIFPQDGTDATTLLGNADAALYRAKADGRGTIRFFAPDIDQRLRDQRALQHDLRQALARDELVLYYQPQAQISGDIVGFEALVRWRHPTQGVLLPAAFIRIAEESGLIMSIGAWILREACRQASSWQAPLQISINLSPVQFQHGDLAGLVQAVLADTGLAPERLELEITETVLVGDFARTVSILGRLKALGVRIAMDDFGTGYSSLSYLQSFPFDKIKIDRAFISNLERNEQSAAIIRAVIGLGRGLHLPVIAEGVETEAQRVFLTRENCDGLQGYLVGEPRPIQDYAELTGGMAPANKPVALAG